MSGYTIDVQETADGDLYITLPDEITDELNWRADDVLEWDVKGNGIQITRLNDSLGYEVDEG